jgi:hypothetical protein
MTTIDTSGNAHRPAGSPAGGQFAGKVNSSPADTLNDTEDLTDGDVLFVASVDGREFDVVESLDGYTAYEVTGNERIDFYTTATEDHQSIEDALFDELERRAVPAGARTPAEPVPAHAVRRGASLGRGSFGGFGMSRIRKMQGREGEAFSANLTLNGKVVGEVIQDGRGGETWARFNSAEARAAFTDLVEKEWAFDQEYEFGGEKVKAPHTSESVLDALYAETDTRRRLNRNHKAGKLSVLLSEDLDEVGRNDGISTFREVRGGVGSEASIAADLKRRGQLDGALYWNGGEWVRSPRDSPLSASLTPATADYRLDAGFTAEQAASGALT